MHKGTIVLIPFPFTDLSGQKVRPALVLYDNKGGEDCIVSFISSRVAERAGKFEIKAVHSLENGLKGDSLIKVDKIATLQKRIVMGELGMLESPLLAEVDVRLKKLFGV
jgi:mRNA interferase MazF